jgi:exodeoxyribonuclease VII large subunit
LYLDDLSTNLGRNFLIFAERKEERLKDYAGNLYFRKPHLMLKEPYEKLRVKKDIFHQSFSRYFDAKKEKYKNYISKLEALSPLSVLKRGYSITKNVRTNKIIKGRKDVNVYPMVKLLVKLRS